MHHRVANEYKVLRRAVAKIVHYETLRKEVHLDLLSVLGYLSFFDGRCFDHVTRAYPCPTLTALVISPASLGV